MAVSANQLTTGSVIGGYRIEGLISRGGMGLVYRATNLALDRIYALKVLAPELAADEKFQERFKREMRTAASLHHPNVVGIHYAGEHDGLWFFVMDLITGTDLREVLVAEGPLEPARAVDLLRQVSSALDAAHAVGLVHRDVKPGNILIAPKDGAEHAYLTDFGLAKRPNTASGLTATGLVVGTVDYIAPEQINGSEVDARSDTYAMGCVFYQMLSGDVPYRRENTFATLLAHLNEPPPKLDGPVAQSHPGFAAVIEKAMCKNPGGRYFSAGDFARDAAAALVGERYSGPPTIVGTGEANPLRGGGVVATGASGAAAAQRAGRAAQTTIKTAGPSEQPTPVAQTEPQPTEPHAGAGGTPPQPPRQESEPPRPWYRRWPGAAALAVALLIGVVVALLAGHVIGGGKSQTTQSQVAVTQTGASTARTSTVTQTATATVTTSQTQPPPPSQGSGALTAVDSYWNDIATGDYAGAYSLLAPGSLNQTESQFIAQHQAENITNVKFRGAVQSSNGTQATVSIVTLQTTDSANGCRNWSGQYQLSDASGSWLIEQASLTPSACA